MTGDVSIPDVLRGGYRRVDPGEVTIGTDVAVMYNGPNGRNIRKGTVVAVEATDGGVRVTVDEAPDRQVDRLLLDPSGEDEREVLAETAVRTKPLGEFEALYAASE